jgi:glycerophosphoryl diester phosphodiesterase
MVFNVLNEITYGENNLPRSPEFPNPLVLAHRMHVIGYPENTVLALKQACEMGVDWIEFDVKVLTDGALVSLHDGTVDRTTDGTGDITKMNLKEVRQLNAGKGYDFGFVPIPTVEEILQVLQQNPKIIRAEMHIHNLYEPEPLVALLDKYHVRDRCYFNFNAIILAEHLREDLNDKESLVSLNSQGDSPELAELCNQFDLAYLCVPVETLKPSFVDHIHHYRTKHPVFAQCYPVHTEAGWQKMIDMGVDVIQTDYPEALMEYLEARKLR